MTRIDWKSIGVAYALATLWFIVSWKELLYSATNDYLKFDDHSSFEHLAIFLNVFLLTLFLLWLNIRMTGPSPSGRKVAFQILFILAGILSFGPLSTEIMKWLSPETKRLTGTPLPIIVAGLCIALAMRKPDSKLSALVSNVKTAALLMLPFCLFIIVKSVHMQVFDEGDLLAHPIEGSFSPKSQQANRTKIVWIVFDELDYAAMQLALQTGKGLPAFEGLMAESLVASHAVPPAQNTLEAVPALLTGKLISSAEIVSHDDLMLYPADGTSAFSFKQSNNIFKEIGELGGNTAVVGWYHPYPRILRESGVAYCYSGTLVKRRCARGSDILPCMLGHAVRSIRSLPIAGRLIPVSIRTMSTEEFVFDTESQIERTEYLNAKAKSIISDPRLNLLFFHFSVPHPPYLPISNAKRNYFTTLEVADATLADMRQALELSGQWDGAYVVVSSDHPWRKKADQIESLSSFTSDQQRALVQDQRIPFILKFPAQHRRIDYDGELNTVLTKEIVKDMFKGKLSDPEALVRWLSAKHAESASAKPSSNTR